MAVFQRLALLLILGTIVSATVWADQQCWVYSISGSGQTGTGSTRAAACSDLGSKLTTTGETQSKTSTGTPTGVDEGPWGCDVDWHSTITDPNHTCPPFSNCSESGTDHYDGGGRASAQCDACSSQAGKEAFVGGGSSPGMLCSGGCEVNAPNATTTIRGGGESSPTIYQSTYTGNSCDEGTGDASGKCAASGGVTACAESGKNCGTFNGDEVCPQSLQPGQCQSFASGGVACVASAGAPGGTSPPAPDNGTPGTPATPSGTVQSGPAGFLGGGGGSTANYYSSTVVSNSSTTVLTQPGGKNVGDGGTGTQSGDCTAGPACDDAASGGQTCDAAPVCSGDEVECNTLYQAWKARCPGAYSDSDVHSAVGDPPVVATDSHDLSNALDETIFGSGGASCPTNPTFSFLSTTYTIPAMDYACEFMEGIAGIVLAASYLVGAAIVFWRS